MITVETIVLVNPDGTTTIKLPPEIVPGKHKVVLIIDGKNDSESHENRTENSDSEDKPWMKFAGIFKDDPDFEEFQQTIEEYRNPSKSKKKYPKNAGH